MWAAVILLIELLMVFQCMQIAFKCRFCVNKYMISIIIIEMVVYIGINMKIIPFYFSGLYFVLLFIFCQYEIKQDLKKTIIGFIWGTALACCFEVAGFLIMDLICNKSSSINSLFLSSLLAFLLSIGIQKAVFLLSSKKIIINSKRIIELISVLFCILALIGLFTDYYYHQGTIKAYSYTIFPFILFMFYYLYRWEQARHEIEQKDYELELQRIYGGAYEELLNGIRRRQHDYKNQLSAIYSMHLAAHSFEELVEMQTKYEHTIQTDGRYDSVLTCCTNPILAGYIYSRCIFCEDNKIAVDYSIYLEKVECDFPIHEIIEILGILINNAFESIIENEPVHKKIRLDFLEDQRNIRFAVANPTEYVPYCKIDKMFQYGYSDKGKNRGIGLSRVLELVNKYGAEIEVSNQMYNEQNWINFIIKIKK